MLFSHEDAKYLTLYDNPIASASSNFTKEPLGLEVDINVLPEKNDVFVMSSISRVQQSIAGPAKNSIYRTSISNMEVSTTNTGTDHRDFLRRSIIMTGIIASPGKKEIALQV